MREQPVPLTSSSPFVLFVELAPWSVLVDTDKENHFFGRPKDRFWELFTKYNVGMLKEPDGGPLTENLTAEQDEEVHEIAKMDFTFYIDDAIRYSTDARKEEMNEGKKALKELIITSTPRIICFVGVESYRHFYQKRGVIDFGLQSSVYSYYVEGKRFNAEVFVLPSTMKGNLGSSEADIVEVWKELHNTVKCLKELQKKKEMEKA